MVETIIDRIQREDIYPNFEMIEEAGYELWENKILIHGGADTHNIGVLLRSHGISFCDYSELDYLEITGENIEKLNNPYIPKFFDGDEWVTY